MTLNAQVKEVCQLVVSLGETPEYLHNSLNNMGIENVVKAESEKWEVYFKNESSDDDSISITHLEFEV